VSKPALDAIVIELRNRVASSIAEGVELLPRTENLMARGALGVNARLAPIHGDVENGVSNYIRGAWWGLRSIP
jgi:hypothetical protein